MVSFTTHVLVIIIWIGTETIHPTSYKTEVNTQEVEKPSFLNICQYSIQDLPSPFIFSRFSLSYDPIVYVILQRSFFQICSVTIIFNSSIHLHLFGCYFLIISHFSIAHHIILRFISFCVVLNVFFY